MTSTDAQALRLQSKILFGQVHRLEVMIAIAKSDGLVNPSDLLNETQMSAQSALQTPLRSLEQAGLIMRMPTTAGRTYYQRQDSLVWPWILQVAEEFSLASMSVRERS